MTVSDFLWFAAGLVVGLWIGSRMAARRFTSTATEPYGVEWRGRIYDVHERPREPTR